jgi:hypothetical protein
MLPGSFGGHSLAQPVGGGGSGSVPRTSPGGGGGGGGGDGVVFPNPPVVPVVARRRGGTEALLSLRSWCGNTGSAAPEVVDSFSLEGPVEAASTPSPPWKVGSGAVAFMISWVGAFGSVGLSRRCDSHAEEGKWGTFASGVG